MNRASVVVAGYTTHPESGASLLRVMVDQPFARGGLRCETTDLWAERSAPQPATGEAVEWDHRHVWIRGVRYDKPENDRPTNMPLH
ncbi:MAG TPA: hypothetical protein VHL34_24880 [Rhizomicrobium sp.]|jgi:hypothetical protein|nr:hypothetical protein [Rhizomicrobium sp.]